MYLLFYVYIGLNTRYSVYPGDILKIYINPIGAITSINPLTYLNYYSDHVSHTFNLSRQILIIVGDLFQKYIFSLW